MTRRLLKRFRYEFNNKLGANLVSRGLAITGRNPGRDLVEVIEIPEHPWFVGVQFHPELRSRPEQPHPLFVAFVAAALDRPPFMFCAFGFGALDDFAA